MHSHLGPPGSSINPPREHIGNAETGSHICTTVARIYPQKNYFGDAGSVFSSSNTSWPHFSSQWFHWGYLARSLLFVHHWQCSIKLIPWRRLQPVLKLVQFLTSLSPENDSFRNARNAFSCLKTSWHHFSEEWLYLGCWECIHMIFQRMARYFYTHSPNLSGMLALYSHFCKIGGQVFSRNYPFRNVGYDFSCWNNRDSIFPHNKVTGGDGIGFSHLSTSGSISPSNQFTGDTGIAL